jgi:hypothetical protein
MNIPSHHPNTACGIISLIIGKKDHVVEKVKAFLLPGERLQTAFGVCESLDRGSLGIRITLKTRITNL